MDGGRGVEFKRFCVICGTFFETTNGYKATCSQLCSERRDQEGQRAIYAMIDEAVPEALAVLGLDSIDEYPAWKEQQKRGCVYFIQAGEDGPIKIGFSKDVESRLTDLQVASPEELRLLRTIEGTKEDEAHVHYLFSSYRLRGEWFEPAICLERYIASL